MFSIKGITWFEVLRRTWHESWEDEVYGQAARLAFYHFLAIFPSILLLLIVLAKFPDEGRALRSTLIDGFGRILPRDAAGLIAKTVQELNGSVGLRGGIVTAMLAAVWAAMNGTWAVISGLNTAYEVDEDRPWIRVTAVTIGLTISLAVFGFVALSLMFYTGPAAIARWPVIVILLFASFTLLYRFGPNLTKERWRWVTPGSLVALVLWIACTLVFRWYCDHFNKYPRLYGSMAAAAMLLFWLYLAGAAVLIGGEVNCEVQKALDVAGEPDAHSDAEKRNHTHHRSKRV